MRCVLISILLLLFSSGLSGAMPGRIQWAINDAPPFHILSGPYQNKGICDALISAVHRALPEVASSVWVMPQPRISQALNDQTDLCFPCMIYRGSHNERAYFSQPTHIYEPYQILSRLPLAAEIANRYGSPVAFELLLSATQYRLGYPAGRRYAELQPLLDKYPPFLARPGVGGAVTILQMIQAERLDYTIDYPVVANYFNRTGQGNISSLPIKEQQQDHIPGAIGCARSDWGRQVVNLINSVMPQVRQDPVFLEVLNLWSGADGESYQRFNQQHLARPEYQQVTTPE